MPNQAAPQTTCHPWNNSFSSLETRRKLEILSNYRLSVKFIDGTRGEVDLSRLILSNHAGVFSLLRDPAIFAQAHY